MLAASGTNLRLLRTGVFVLGALLAGLAGALVAPQVAVTPGMDAAIVVSAFIVAVVGGLGSVVGAALGALIIGAAQTIGTSVAPSWASSFTYLAMIVVLAARPLGAARDPGALTMADVRTTLPDADAATARLALADPLPVSRVRRLTAAAVGPLLLVAVLVIAGQVLSLTNVLTLENAVGLAVFAVATNLLVGYGGLVSFGQAAFYGAGSYTVALGWLHWQLSFWLTFVLAPIDGAVLSFLVGLIALRSRRLYFALLTLAFSQLFYVLAEERYSFTQGANGVIGPMIPDSLVDPRTSFLFVLAVAAGCLLILWKVTASPFGLVLRAIRENRERARGARRQRLRPPADRVRDRRGVLFGGGCVVRGLQPVGLPRTARLDPVQGTRSSWSSSAGCSASSARPWALASTRWAISTWSITPMTGS